MFGFHILKNLQRRNTYQYLFVRILLYICLNKVPRQTDTHRSKLLSTYSTEELYQAKRKCNATQEYDINLLEGELVAVIEQKDPLGSTSRWLVDTGSEFFA